MVKVVSIMELDLKALRSIYYYIHLFNIMRKFGVGKL